MPYDAHLKARSQWPEVPGSPILAAQVREVSPRLFRQAIEP